MRKTSSKVRPRFGDLLRQVPRWPGRVRDLFFSHIRIVRRGKTLRATLATEPRRAADEPPKTLLDRQRAELSARLLVADPTTQVVRHLFVVHDELRRNGWPGVESLPLNVVSRALTEAEILCTDEPTPMLSTIVDTLKKIKVDADARATIEALDDELEHAPLPEVSDSDFAEFELMERSWSGTVPAGL